MKTLLAVIFLMFLGLGCLQTGPSECPAGTQWCNASQKCISSSENCSVACTAEAKICPDGTAVGRTGPNCEFAPCPAIVGNDTDEHGCKPSAGYSWCEPSNECIRVWETPCRLTLEDALNIAESGDCAKEGRISDVDAQFNNNSKTWWFSLEANKSGCNPACVVYENQSSEINWRCTGLIQYDLMTMNTSLGEILVDGDGFTLYTFTPDSTNNSTCTGVCAENWPPLIVRSENMTVTPSILRKIGIFPRNSKAIQVTFNGMPLYYYIGDAKPGDTKGEGLGGKWYVVKVD